MKNARHAEVGKLYASFRGDQNVGGLHVAVNDPFSMGDGESDGDIAGPSTSTRIGNGAFFQDTIERLTVHKFHDEVWCLGCLVDAHIMQRQNGRVRNLTNGTCFLKEAIAGCAAGDFRGKDLDGDNTPDERVVCADDAAEGARADRVENLITTDLHLQILSTPRWMITRMSIENELWEGNEAEVPVRGVR